MMLRKELYGGDPARAALSAFGQCRLLADGALPTVQEQCDAVVALQPLLSAGLPLRAQLYASLLSVLGRTDALHGEVRARARDGALQSLAIHSFGLPVSLLGLAVFLFSLPVSLVSLAPSVEC